MMGKFGSTQRNFKEEFKVSSRLFGATQLIKGINPTGVIPSSTVNGEKSKSREASKQTNLISKEKDEAFKKIVAKSNLRVATGISKKI